MVIVGMSGSGMTLVGILLIFGTGVSVDDGGDLMWHCDDSLVIAGNNTGDAIVNTTKQTEELPRSDMSSYL